MPATEAWQLAAHLGYGMSALHIAGGVHNDLHAGNVLRSGDLWKIGDFGGVTTVTEGTHGPWRHGDRAIQPPECARDPVARPANDVWAAGLLLHKAITASSVVPRSPEAIARLERGIIDVAPGMPRALDRLVRSCLSVNRKRRPWSGVEFLQALSRPRTAITTSRPGMQHVVALDERGKPWWKTDAQPWRRIPTSSSKQGCRLLSVAASSMADSRHTHAFGVTEEGDPWHAWCEPGKDWRTDYASDSGWESDDARPRCLSAVTAASSCDGHVEVFFLDVFGKLFHRYWWGAWSGWHQQSSPADHERSDIPLVSLSFVAEWNSNPLKLRLFGVDHQGRLWERPFVGTSGFFWMPWQLVRPQPPRPLTCVSAAHRCPGHFEICGVADDCTLWHSWSNDNGASFAKWYELESPAGLASVCCGAEWDDRGADTHQEIGSGLDDKLHSIAYRNQSGRWMDWCELQIPGG